MATLVFVLEGPEKGLSLLWLIPKGRLRGADSEKLRDKRSEPRVELHPPKQLPFCRQPIGC